MYFERPLLLLSLVLIVPVVILIFKASYGGDKEVRRVLKAETQGLRRAYTEITLVWTVFLACLAVAAAGPYMPKYGPPDLPGTGDYVILVDISASTDARNDPNGKSLQEINREIIMEIADTMPSARFQILGYTKLTFSLSGFTNDRDVLEDTVNNSLRANAIPSPGSNLVNALEVLSGKILNDPAYAGVEYVILFSDGNYYSDSFRQSEYRIERAREASNTLAGLGVKIISVGVGSPAGMSIPMYDKYGNFTGRYRTLRDGRTYITRLKAENLHEISSVTDGMYFHSTDKDALVQYLKETLSDTAPAESINPEVIKKQNVSAIFLLISAASLVLIFRRELY